MCKEIPSEKWAHSAFHRIQYDSRCELYMQGSSAEILYHRYQGLYFTLNVIQKA